MPYSECYIIPIYSKSGLVTEVHLGDTFRQADTSVRFGGWSNLNWTGLLLFNVMS